MNYLKIYISLIEKAKNRKIEEGVYYEKHHTIPKSIFNNNVANKILNYCNIKFENSVENIVHLIAREHFIAHILLLKIFRKINKDAYERMLFAARFLTNRFKINNKQYDYLRQEFAIMMSNILKGKPSRATGCKWSEERKKIGQIHLKGKTYEEIHGEKKARELRESRSAVRRGKTLDEICGKEMASNTRIKLSNRKITAEWRKKLSEAKKGQRVKESTRKKRSIYMSNDKLNHFVDQQKYIFKHIDKNQVVVMRKFDMKKLFGCFSIRKVVSGDQKSNKGWQLIGKYEEEEK